LERRIKILGKKFDLYQEITNRIIAKLEQGTIPWEKPFQ
jgi:antirestriction protein ArdC